MIDLLHRIRAGKSAPWLWLLNRRVVSGVVTPAVLALALAGVYLPQWDDSLVFWVAAATALVLGYVFTHWHAITALFWFEFHLLIFKFAKRLADDDARRKWFQQVRVWMERHGLVGRNANRLLFGADDRSRLAHTYDAVVRRASGRGHDAVEAGGNLVSQDLRDKWSEIHDRVEEIPHFGRLAYFKDHWWLELATRSMLMFWFLVAPQAAKQAGNRPETRSEHKVASISLSDAH